MLKKAVRVASRYLEQTKTARGWDGKFLGKDARLLWDRNAWLLEELPQKGKKKLNKAKLDNPGGRGMGGFGAYIPENILRDAKLSKSDNYDKIKHKMEKAYEEAYEATIASLTQSGLIEKHPDPELKWVKSIKWYENQIFYLHVEPEGVEPFIAEGKDFSVEVNWKAFRAKMYSSSSGPEDHDPSYTMYESKSPGAARKMYKMLKADPNALKSVPWGKFSDWLNKNKIGYSVHFSSWR